jgi:hypothetical protein
VSLHVDLSWILEVAHRAGQQNPAPDDYGVPVAAVQRHRAVLMDHPVYGGPYARAAALAHTLGRCRWLERSNTVVAVAAAAMYLQANQVAVIPDKNDALRLTEELLDNRSTAASVAAVLRTWPVGG